MKPQTGPRSATIWRCAAAGVFVISLALYTLTLAPTVTLVDSGELIVVANGWGIAHPPGFPLYTLLAHVAAHVLPFADVARRVNFFSALCAALAAAGVVLVAGEAFPPAPQSPSPQPRRGKRTLGVAADVTPRAAGAELVAAVSAALLLACSRTLWSYATIAEVYTLNTLLIVVVLCLMFRWRQQAIRHPPSAELNSAADLPLYGAAFVFGLALGVHHVTVGLMLPALAWLVVATRGVGFFGSKPFAYCIACAFTGLLVYLYLPLAASQSPLLNWGDPRTLQRLWWHVVGKQYLVSLSFSPSGMAQQARDFVRLAAREFGPAWLPIAPALAIAGAVSLWRRDRPLLYFLLLVIVCDLAYAFNYDIAEDKDAYYLPTFIAVALAVAFGARRVMILAAERRELWSSSLAAAALLVVPLVALASNLPFNDRSRYFVAHDYVENILRTVEPNGMLLTIDWQVCAPMLYTRAVEDRRRDVTVIDVNLLRRWWYFDYLRHEYPDLIDGSSDKIAPFLEDLLHWEQDPAAYERNTELNRRISTRFADMILAFVSRHLQVGPVYITQDVILNPDTRDSELSRALNAQYQLVPQGLVFQLFSDRGFHDPAEPRLDMRGLADDTLRFDSDDVVMLKVRPVYVTMLYNRGRYLALSGRHQRAIDAFRQALAMDPYFEPAHAALADSERAIAATK